jgi:hypothetical protein
MDRHGRGKQWVLNTTIAVGGILCLMTLVWPDWIEAIFGLDPDGGDGSVERWIARGVALAALTAVIVVSLVRRSLARVGRPLREAPDHG